MAEVETRDGVSKGSGRPDQIVRCSQAPPRVLWQDAPVWGPDGRRWGILTPFLSIPSGASLA